VLSVFGVGLSLRAKNEEWTERDDAQAASLFVPGPDSALGLLPSRALSSGQAF